MIVKDEKIKRQKLRKNLPYAWILPELVPLILSSTDKRFIQKIYLFGSYAYGKPKKTSDLDICVILDNVDSVMDIYGEIRISLFYKNIDECDLLVYRENEFYHGKNPKSIENTIMEKGKLLYER